MKPTPQQEEAVAAANTGKPLRLSAYAGTGKTSTLKLIARSSGRRGVYLAFNKEIATAAGRDFPDNVACSTTHSMAFRSIIKQGYSSAKMTGSFNGRVIAEHIKIDGLTIPNLLALSQRSVAFLVAETIKRWLRGRSAEIAEFHVPTREGKLAGIDEKHLGEIKGYVARKARAAWDLMTDPGHALPMSHDGYLKLWALSDPRIEGDFVMLDEAQDTNGVVMGLMMAQSSQVISVGDQYQQIYEWRGAQNAMRELPCDVEARLTQSFRFGPEIAANASRILELLGEPIPLLGNPAKASRIGAVTGKASAYLYRTNGSLLDDLMDALDAGERPYVTGGTSELLSYVGAAEKLMAGQTVDYPVDFFGFADWADVKAAAESEEGGDLQRWVRVIEKYGTERLKQAISRLPQKEQGGQYVMSTGHRSKGREWPQVVLSDDFLRGVKESPGKGEHISADAAAAELRLLYVAATRGEQVVHIPPPVFAKLEVLEGARAAA